MSDGKKVEEIEDIEQEDELELEDDTGEELDREDEYDTVEDDDNDESDDSDDEDEEVHIGFQDEDDSSEDEDEDFRGKPAPDWVKEMRKEHRQLKREKKELEAKMAKLEKGDTEQELPKKPQLEDFDYDTERYDEALLKWNESKRQHEAKRIEAEKRQQQEQEEWVNTVKSYEESKKTLKVRDFESAEFNVQDTLSDTQQAILVQGANDPAKMVYALGNSMSKLKELSKITNPVKFSAAIGRLESELKVTNRKKTPPPEKTVSGKGRSTNTGDSTLEKLRAKAEKTGDYSEVIRYKQKLREND